MRQSRAGTAETHSSPRSEVLSRLCAVAAVLLIANSLLAQGEPCTSLGISCSTNVPDQVIVVEVFRDPEECACEDVDIFINDVPVASQSLSEPTLFVGVPEDCFDGGVPNILQVICSTGGAAASCNFQCSGGQPRFKRGDVDVNDRTNITDAVALLNYLFASGETPQCLDAADVDDSGTVNITDAVSLLNFLFAGGPSPAEPFESCNHDPNGPTGDDDGLGCSEYELCLFP